MSVPREWICLQAAVAFRLAPRRARLRQQSCTACSRCIMRDALPRDFARINLLQWFSRAGFGDETVFLRARNRVETEPRCGEIETRERGPRCLFPPTRERITPPERDEGMDRRQLLKLRQV